MSTSNKKKLIKELHFDRYFEAKNWADYNLKFFENLAHKYDATNQLHSFGAKGYMDQMAVKRLPIAKGSKILDLCTGSGDIAIKIVKAYDDVSVVGIDASGKMLDVARERSKGLKNLVFEKGDALNLHFKDNEFDGVVISFGLRNLSDINEGFLEMKRVLKPTGFICNIDQSKPKNWFWKLVYRAYFYNVAPLLGKIVFHRGEFNSFRYLAESNKYFPDQDELCALMSALELRVDKTYNYFFGAVGQQIAYVN